MINESLKAFDKSVETIGKFKWIKIYTDILNGKWLIVLLSLLGLTFSLIYVFGQKPLYTASTLIYVENSDKHLKNNIIELINSDSVLSKVIQNLKLDIVHNPLEVTYLSQIYAKFLSQSEIDKPQIEYIDNILKNYNWSKESISILMFDVPKQYENKIFILEVTSNNSYTIIINENIKINGTIDKLTETKDSSIRIIINDITAAIGTKFKIEKQSSSKALGILQSQLVINSNEKSDFVHINLIADNESRLLLKLNHLLKTISSDPPNSQLVKNLLSKVTVIDKAILDVPSKKVINKTNIIALGWLCGILAGILIVLPRAAINRRTTISNPGKLEDVFEIPVYATIPFTNNVDLTHGLSKRQKSLLALQSPNDSAIESLRSLRTSLHFALLESKNNIVMITGPSPGIGKSFISSNFSAVLAAGEQRVLLIDADMRKGYMHKLFNKAVSPGLTNLISDTATLEEVIHTIELEETTIDIITRGQTPPNPSELLMHSNFENVLNTLSGLYDLIIIDTPPVHAVTDPSIIGRHAGVVFMVVQSEYSNMKEIEHAIYRLAHTGIETKGFILNGFNYKKSSSLYDNRYLYSYADSYK